MWKQMAVQVLSTGAVVVDLPGVRDANAARGAVAEKYMKSCNAVWIVADITRAVDNRTAKVAHSLHHLCGFVQDLPSVASQFMQCCLLYACLALPFDTDYLHICKAM